MPNSLQGLRIKDIFDHDISETIKVFVLALLAIISWLIYNYAGIREKGFLGYCKGVMFPPDVPWFAYILLTPIELATALVLRPATLAIQYSNSGRCNSVITRISCNASSVRPSHASSSACMACRR